MGIALMIIAVLIWGMNENLKTIHKSNRKK
jgi:hypothetical protein